MVKVPKEIQEEILDVTESPLRKELVKAATLLSELRVKIAKLPGALGGKTKPVLSTEDKALFTELRNGEKYIDKVLEKAKKYEQTDISNTRDYLDKGKRELESVRKRYGY